MQNGSPHRLPGGRGRCWEGEGPRPCKLARPSGSGVAGPSTRSGTWPASGPFSVMLSRS